MIGMQTAKTGLAPNTAKPANATAGRQIAKYLNPPRDMRQENRKK